MAIAATLTVEVRVRRLWLIAAMARLWGLTGWERPLRAALRTARAEYRAPAGRGRWRCAGTLTMEG